MSALKRLTGRRLMAVVVLFALAVASLAVAIADLMGSGGAGPDEALGGVVLIHSEYADPLTGLTAHSYGSGFAVGRQGSRPEYFITGYHAIEDAINHKGTVRIVFSERDAAVASVVKLIPDKDMAILRIPEATDQRRVLALRRSFGNSGERVYALGYPADASVAGAPPTAASVEGTLGGRTALPGSALEAYEISSSLTSGHVGGPLIDGKGHVLGVVMSSGTGSAAPTGAAVIDQLLPSLREMEIPHAVVGDRTTAWIALALCAFLGAGGVFLVMTPAPVPGDDGEPSVPDESAGNRRAPEPVLLAADRMPPSKRVPVLKGLSGRFAGKSYPLGDQSIRIGRNPGRCDIVFDGGTPGISGIHCGVGYDASSRRFSLVDLGSSYGTYLSDGERLTPHHPVYLDDGDSFYLANQDHQFIVLSEAP